MNNVLAFEFLKNLIERIDVNPETGKAFLTGNISFLEIEAMNKAIEVLGGHPAVHAPAIQPAHAVPSVVIPEPAQPTEEISSSPQHTNIPPLVLDSLEAELSEEVLLCLDFGTAMSKAFATIIEDDEVVDELPLKLGKRAKQEGGLIYPVPSSLWIADDGHIFLGQKAIALSLQDPSGKHQRFDSLKKELTMGLTEITPDKIQLPPEINPTSVKFSKGDAITLYLAYLTDLVGSELEEVYGQSRYALRRFALPSWPDDRRAWGEKMLSKMLAKAQIIADTLHERWDQGVPIWEAKAIMEKVDELENLPEHLIKEGISEPLAAGSSRLKREESARGLVMVVDVGAGTSDMALFLVAEDPERNIFNAFPILNCSTSLSMAGDTLDGAILNIVREKERLDNGHPDFSHLMAALRMRVRILKEDIFRDGSCTYILNNGSRGSISLDEFLGRAEVIKFKERLAETFQEVFEQADPSFFERFQDSWLTVVLTGGGATLPMVKELAIGQINARNGSMNRAQAALVPEDYENDPELSVVYPQLAVAIGGASPTIINERYSLREMGGRDARETWVLGRTAITGN